MRKKIILTAILISFTLLYATSGICAGEKTGSEPAEEERIEKMIEEAESVAGEPEKLEKEDIVLRLYGILKYHPDILSLLKGVEAKEDESGVFYTYKGTRLEELDRETALGLLRTANQQITLKNLENIRKIQEQQKQFEQLNRIEDIKRIQKMLEDKTPPRAPRIPESQKAPGR